LQFFVYLLVAQLGGPHGLPGGFLNLAEDGLHLGGCALGLLGEGADLVGDHGKAPPVSAGPRCLDAGVQCQEVALRGDLADGGDDLVNPLRLLGKLDQIVGDGRHLGADLDHAVCGQADGVLAVR